MSEEVLELSIQETNELRKNLGLKPLRTATTSTATTNANVNVNAASGEELALSIQESNNLREKLGLAPLRSGTANADANEAQYEQSKGAKASTAIHAPPKNTRGEELIQERIANAKLKREVQAGILKLEKESLTSKKNGQVNVNDEEEVTISWADRMRAQSSTSTGTGKSQSQTQSSRAKVVKETPKEKNRNYTDSDFEEQNITVGHRTSDFELGSTTVLTLKDKSILEAEEDGDDANALENVNMAESAVMEDNLKRKRAMELGTGHAGGYAGYDDDEFEELGGTQAAMILGRDPSRTGGLAEDDKGSKGVGGFKLAGTIADSREEEKNESDLFAGISGQSISLMSDQKEGVHQADFMSYEEEEAMGLGGIGMSKVEMEKKRKKKEKKLMKKLKKDKKKKSRKDRKGGEDDDELVSSANGEDQSLVSSGAAHDTTGKVVQGASLLEELAASSQSDKNKRRRKRRRDIDSDDSEDEDTTKWKSATATGTNEGNTKIEDKDESMQQQRKDKFHTIMEKGNQRSHAVFQPKDQKEANTTRTRSAEVTAENDVEAPEDDDAFLSAAISKARRLRRLRELNAKGKVDALSENSKGASGVVHALKMMKENDKNLAGDQSNNGKITFELGTTKEFTRALRAQPGKQDVATLPVPAPPDKKNTQVVSKVEVEDVLMEEAEEDANEEHQTLEELADQVEDEPDGSGAFESTGSNAGVGRGMSAFLGLLKQTGEIAGKSAGKEELRGRAKDEKTYDDYAPVDLKKVVKIDTTGLRGRPHEKDVEFANREIKLEYRDDHGRLLTRKEAYRQLCYQFHGHGSSKKNEERRLQQIEREQTERSANNGVSGTLGALKATQKATGKAFVLHKT